MNGRTHRFTLCLALALASNCNKPTPTPARVDARAEAATPAVDNSPLTPPDRTIFVLRGTGLRKVLTLVAAGAPPGVVLGQVAPGFSPGIGEHGVDIDPDAPFAALAMPPTEGDMGRLQLFIAWPLRSGMQVAQDAQAGTGFREVSPGLYEPTAAAPTGDAGVAAYRNPCWVARKQPAGWMLICGQRDQIRTAANFLVRAGSRAPENDAVVDLTFRPEAARPLLTAQMAALEAQDPRTAGADAGVNTPEIRAEYDAAHRTATTYREIVEDMRTLHAALTIDDTRYHLRGEADFAAATGATTRALLASTIGRHGAAELLARLPAVASSYVGMSLDGAALGPLLGAEPSDDPRVLQLAGPEFARFQRTLQQVSGIRHAGERAIGFMSDNNGTRIEVIRMPDAAATLQTLRAAATAVPRTRRPSGFNAADQFAIVAVPATLPAGSLRLRLTPDPARLPADAPAELRQMYARTTLLVPDGDKLILIEAQDPVAHWNAMQTGEHLTAQLSDEQTGAMHLGPLGLLMLMGVPATEDIRTAANGDPMDGTLTARRVGDAGGHFELRIDAPIASVNQTRDVLAQIQAQQQRQMQEAQQQQMQMQQQMQQAQRQMLQQQAGARRGPANPGALMPTPMSPDQLPEPNFQLRPPLQ
jgi:hypothetical protein